MTTELISALASVGTLIVIAATAIAAIGQLRHMRAGNQISALNELRQFHESEQFLQARKYVFEQLPVLVQDPEFRRQLYLLPGPASLRPVSTVANLYETIGALVKRGALDADTVCDLWGTNAVMAWTAFEPVIAARRHVYGPVPWENFEYFVGLSKAWLARHAQGSLPKSFHRLAVDDRYVQADIAAGVAPAYRGPGSL